MKNKGAVFAIFLVGIMIFSILSGCSKDNGKKKIINKAEVVDEAKDNVVVDGVSVSVPFSLNDLGEGFTFDSNQYFSESNNSYFFISYICHDKKRIMEIQIYNLTEEYKNNIDLLAAEPISFVSVEGSFSGEVLFSGVKVGDNINTVLNKWGEPSSKKDGFMTFSKYNSQETSTTGTLSIYYGSSETDIIDSIKLNIVEDKVTQSSETQS